MGGHSWFYCVPYEKNLENCLAKLRQREFAAGRYNPAEPFPNFPVDVSHQPGRNHASESAARAAADADGTRSILDMLWIGPHRDFGTVTPLDAAELSSYFGTTTPTLTDIEDNEEVFEDIERGHGICIVAHEGGEPSHIYFAGYSYD